MDSAVNGTDYFSPGERIRRKFWLPFPCQMAIMGSMSAALSSIDWPLILDQLAGEAGSESTREAVQSLPLSSDITEIVDQLQLIDEARMVEDCLPRLVFPDIRPILEAAHLGRLLLGVELYLTLRFLDILENARQFLTVYETEIPRLRERFQSLVGFPDLHQRLERSVASDGALLETASERLGPLRREVEALQLHTRQRMEALLNEPPYRDCLQDSYFTLRSNRYVLPIKSGFQSMEMGIVHDHSGSGQTVFLEPTEIIKLNNRLRLAEIELAQEETRILRELSLMLAHQHPALETTFAQLTDFDLVLAKTRLSIRLGGVCPAVDNDGVIHLQSAHHPLLKLSLLDRSVPNDLLLKPPHRLLVISGPNAGGKTVALKTIALIAMLVRVGIIPPVNSDSRIDLFDPILADIGDAQNLASNLSTFSGHLTRLNEIFVAAVRATSPPALILLDELMVGTDPQQGAALAQAYLEELLETSARIIVTTHYDALKALGLSRTDAESCSFEFDHDRHRSTYQLRYGQIGRSFALDLARELCFSPRMVQRAEAILDQSGGNLELMLARIDELQRKLEHERTQLAVAQRQLEGERTTFADWQQQKKSAQQQHLRLELTQFQQKLTALEHDLSAAVRQAIDQGSHSAIHAAQQARSQVVQETAELQHAIVEEPPALVLDLSKVRAGDTIRVTSFNKSGTVLFVDPKRGRLQVMIGGAVMSVAATQCTPENGPRPSVKRLGSAPFERTSAPLPTLDTTLDLRGQRVEEALAQLTPFLDRTLLEQRDTCFILHGHGTGALKKAIREELSRSPYIASFHPGNAAQGGDGVTVVALRE